MTPIRTALALALLFTTGAAAAQTVYKCSEGGKTVYADRPCERGPSRVLPPPAGVDPNADAVRTGDSRTLLETEKLSAKLRAERERRERLEERERARAARAGAARRKQCERLRLQVKWAQEDLTHADSRKAEAARTRLRRRQEAMAVECTA